MDFLVIGGFDIRPGRSRELQSWVRENATALSRHAPEGIELVGIYVSMFGAGKGSGQYKMVWRMDKYGAMDSFAAAAAADGEFARLLDEIGSFGDVRIGAGSSNELLKSVADISIWSDHGEE